MAFYLFPGVMYQRFRESFALAAQSLNEDYQVYDLACQQYLGLGFLFQFIPGTNANTARQQLSNKLGPAIEDRISKKTNRAEGILSKYGTYFRLYSYLNLTPLLGFIAHVVNGFRLGAIYRNKGFFYVETPDDSYSNLKNYGLSWLVNNGLNPIRLTHWVLDLLQRGVYRIFDLGTSTYQQSSIPRIALKGLAGLVFGLLKAPVIAADHLTLLAQALIETLIISPLVHFGTSIKEAYSNSNEKVLFATVKELQDVKELRRTAKDHVDCSYTVMKSMQANSREYIGIEKEALYSSVAKPEQLVAVQGSAEKINKSAALLSIVNSFSTKQKIAKNEIEAVEEAKSVLNLSL